MNQRILIAGIGNIFLGDDGFGVEVVKQLQRRPLSEGITLVDFGIRGMDLVYALLDDYDALTFVDTIQKGEPAGTVYLIEPELGEESRVEIDTHRMDPVKALGLARALGGKLTRTYLVACEPETLGDSDEYEEVFVALSDSVRAAIPVAVEMVESLVRELNSSTAGVWKAETNPLPGGIL
ncbi:MAG: hydrogenase maturation protease [Armatimonadota bacterium]|nr:hydrogenase maturation protease [Armatimonadota bacterium]